jgi:acyl-CoA thioester hydrolase
VRGRWVLVCIDISSGKPKRMPVEFLSIYDAAVVTPG